MPPFPAESASLRVMVFTWNVGHASPIRRELESWLPDRGDGCDLLIVATQENAYRADDDEESYESLEEEEDSEGED